MVNILQVEQGERVQAMIHTRNIEDEDSRFLVMVTRNGTVKRLPVSTLRNLRSNGIRALRLDEGDQLIAVRETDGTRKILIATLDGMAVCFDENDVRPMGREAVGVRGIRLREGDYVVGAARATEGKRVAGRATQGVIVMRFKEEGDQVIALALADKEETQEPAPDTAENTEV